MLQELAARTGAAPWIVAAMLFFMAVWAGIAVRVYRARSEDMDACARLALDGEDATAGDTAPDTGHGA